MNEIKLIVDQRERNAELIKSLEYLGLEIEVKTVPIGDYLASDRVCIERKTVADFESSIMNGRLFDQLERLRNEYDFPILILEGDQDTFRLKHNIINGTIVAIYIDFGIPVLFSHAPANTAELIANIAKREQAGGNRREPSAKGGARAYTNRQFQEFIIGNLPGVGPKLAKALLKHFGSIKKISNAKIEDLMEVEKIGKKKAERIHGVVNSAYEGTEVQESV
ncbi:MAG: helix-hairpin-helix domain-containing protein [Candidatus Marsarchaeota archaeon]|nr:helix-hairpin-helix domain-containing protein [Candidatus Marsarchaeota archaeon]